MLYPSAEYLFGSSAVVQAAAVAAAFNHEGEFLKAAKRPCFVHPRKRISVHDVFLSMGPRLFRRAFRMHFDSFWCLHSILSNNITASMDKAQSYSRKGGRSGGNCSLPPVPNGPIPSSIRLACALWYFAGGSAYDIMMSFNISYGDVLNSVWIVVKAINNTVEFQISYPENRWRNRRKLPMSLPLQVPLGSTIALEQSMAFLSGC
jgi:hypothetical protein